MTDEHATALNSVLSVGGLRAELAAIVRYAGQCAEQDEQAAGRSMRNTTLRA